MQKSKLAQLVSLVVSSAIAAQANAAMAPDNSTLLVTVPNLKPGLEMNAAALWLRPGANNLNYVIFNKELPVQSPSWTEQELNPIYSSAFELGLRYVVPNSDGKDVSLNWTHLKSNTSATTIAPNANFFLGPDYEIGPDGLPIRMATGNVKFTYNVVNLEMGQYVNFGQHFQMRFFGGLGSGQLREEVVSVYSGRTGAPFSGPFSMAQDMTSSFTGVGPRAGMHADYSMDSGFGILGEAGMTALMGDIATSTHFTGSGQELMSLYGQAANHQFIADQNVFGIVPGFDVKLGVSYKHIFSQTNLFTVSAGYQGAVYVNAISQYLPGTVVAGETLTSGGIFVGTMSHTMSNYSVQGPFLNFAVQFG